MEVLKQLHGKEKNTQIRFYKALAVPVKLGF